QNRITEYRAMLQAWKRVGIVTLAGYILGFPADTPAAIRSDIRVIQEELPIDFLEFFILTPLPGSEDQKRLWEQGVAMDPDMNRYDTNHVTVGHPNMSADELQGIWWEAWERYYTRAHLVTILRRAVANGIPIRNVLVPIIWFWSSIFISRLHPLEGGYFRGRSRRERRPGLPIARPAAFYLRYGFELLTDHLKFSGFALWLAWAVLRIRLDPTRLAYSDRSLAGAADEDLDELDLFKITDMAKAAAATDRADRARRRARAVALPAICFPFLCRGCRRLFGRRVAGFPRA